MRKLSIILALMCFNTASQAQREPFSIGDFGFKYGPNLGILLSKEIVNDLKGPGAIVSGAPDAVGLSKFRIGQRLGLWATGHITKNINLKTELLLSLDGGNYRAFRDLPKKQFAQALRISFPIIFELDFGKVRAEIGFEINQAIASWDDVTTWPSAGTPLANFNALDYGFSLGFMYEVGRHNLELRSYLGALYHHDVEWPERLSGDNLHNKYMRFSVTQLTFNYNFWGKTKQV